MAQITINSKLSPITWSTVDNAFADINSNFSELYAAIAISTDPENLESSLIPNITETYNLGSLENRWNDLYLSGSTIYLGNSTITSNGSGIVLPAGSTVNGESIAAGDINKFTSINILGQDSIVASSDSDSFTISSGTGTFITKGSGNTINVSFDQSTDIFGSVFSSDSTLLIDSDQGKIVGPIDITVTDLILSGGLPGQILTTDGLGNISFTDLTNLGNIVFNESTLDTNNDSDIIFNPVVNFQDSISIANNISIGGDIISTGSGTPELFSDNDIVLTASERVIVNTSPLKMASFTTTERDTLIAQNGDMIYNTTVDKFQGYANNTWVDLH